MVAEEPLMDARVGLELVLPGIPASVESRNIRYAKIEIYGW